MPLDKRRARAEIANINITLGRIAATCRALERVATGADPDDHAGYGAFRFSGNGEIVLYGTRDLAEWMGDRPVLITAARARLDRLQTFFPRLERVELPPPAMPYQRVTQRLGAFGQRALPNKVGDIADHIKLSTATRRAVVVCNLGFEDQFKSALRGSLWSNVAFRHFGDVSGTNDFEGVERLLVVGGPFPSADDVAATAGAELGRLVQPERPVKQTVTAPLADGYGAEFQRVGFANPAMQRVLEDILDGGIEQAIGRGRGLNRTAQNPLKLEFLGGACPLSVPAEELTRWEPPNRVAKMLHAGRIHLNAADMFRFHSELFGSLAAARKAKQRLGGADGILENARDLAADWPLPLVRIDWQPAGEGFKRRISIVPASEVAAFRGEVLAVFGGVRYWQFTPFSPGRPNLAPRRPLPDVAAECDADETGSNTLLAESYSEPGIGGPDPLTGQDISPDG